MPRKCLGVLSSKEIANTSSFFLFLRCFGNDFFFSFFILVKEEVVVYETQWKRFLFFEKYDLTTPLGKVAPQSNHSAVFLD